MYTKYEQMQSNSENRLRVKACYTLKQNLYCNNGIFSRGTVVRIKSVGSCAGDYVYTLEGDSITDYYCLKADKHTSDVLKCLFEFNQECTDACNKLEALYEDKRNCISSRLWIYTILIATAGIFIFVSGWNFSALMSFWVNISFMLLGIILLAISLYIPLYTVEKRENLLAKHKQAEISAILKAG